MNDQNEKAAAYVKEILFVFNDLRSHTEKVHQRLGAQDPDWIPLEPSSNKTVRDRILCDYANTNVIVCPLSQNVANNPRMFDIDHFYPQDHLMQTLERLEKESQPLLMEIKNQLRTHFLREYTQSPVPRQTADQYAGTLANSLIPQDKTTGLLRVTGLKHIYYNFRPNLWPLSGSINSSKGKKDSIKFSIQAVLKSTDTSFPEPICSLAKQAFFSEFALNYHDYAELTYIEQAEILSARLDFEFAARSASGAQNSILPHYYNDEDKFVSLLDYFKTTIIGKTACSLAQKTANSAITAFSLAQKIATNSFSQDPRIRSSAKALGIALSNLNRSAKLRLPHAGTSDTNSTQSGSTETERELKIYARDIEKIKKKSKKKSAIPEPEAPSITFHPGISVKNKNTKQRLKKMKKRGNANTMPAPDPDNTNTMEY